MSLVQYIKEAFTEKVVIGDYRRGFNEPNKQHRIIPHWYDWVSGWDVKTTLGQRYTYGNIFVPSPAEHIEIVFNGFSKEKPTVCIWCNKSECKHGGFKKPAKFGEQVWEKKERLKLQRTNAKVKARSIHK